MFISAIGLQYLVHNSGSDMSWYTSERSEKKAIHTLLFLFISFLSTLLVFFCGCNIK